MTVETANVTVPGRLASVPYIRHWLQDVLSGWAVSSVTREDLALAVTELCTNIARHGYSSTTGHIEVYLTRYPHAISVTILDTAPFFIPEKIVPQPPETLAEGGYGLFLIESLMDEVRYERRAEHGNRTTLVKYE
jgi:serine/threonine-protein kinase RsbW